MFKSASKLALIITILGVFVLAAMKIEMSDTLRSIAMMIVVYYFGRGNNDEIKPFLPKSADNSEDQKKDVAKPSEPTQAVPPVTPTENVIQSTNGN